MSTIQIVCALLGFGLMSLVNELEALLLPLRKQYAVYSRQYDNAGKEALEQAVLRALRSPPRKVESV